jgi:hypothetical protein
VRNFSDSSKREFPSSSAPFTTTSSVGQRCSYFKLSNTYAGSFRKDLAIFLQDNKKVIDVHLGRCGIHAWTQKDAA